MYQLTKSLVSRAGFSDLSRVRVYGYGGNLQDEVLDGSKLAATDDLSEVATCTVNGKRLFYAKGPVSWSDNNTGQRTRNPYSDYGYYFITEGDGEPGQRRLCHIHKLFLSLARFLSQPARGRRLQLVSRRTQPLRPHGSDCGQQPDGDARASRRCHHGQVLRARVGWFQYHHASQHQRQDSRHALHVNRQPIRPRQNGQWHLRHACERDWNRHRDHQGAIGQTMRLDYVSAAWDVPMAAPNLNGTFPTWDTRERWPTKTCTPTRR